MDKSYSQGPKERYRKAFTVPAVSGNYAEERITFGPVAEGMNEQSFREIMALAEAPFVTSAVVELWLRRVADGTEPVSSENDDDHTLAGTNFTTLTAAGGVRWLMSGWPGAQIRVKSGGFPGSLNVSASGF